MTEPTSTARRSSWIFSVIVAVVLCYLIISSAVSGALINANPAVATAWWPRSPLAGVGVADERVHAGDYKAALKAANWALSREPLNVAALRDAGLAHDKLGQVALGDRLLLFAGDRSWRDLPTELWLLWHNVRTRHFDAAVQDADAVLRVSADQHTDLQVQALLDAAASYPPTARPLIEALAASPPWRPGFLAGLAGSAAPASACDALLAGLTTSHAPPKPGEYAPCVNRMVQEGHYDLALKRWRVLAPQTPGAAAPIRDGQFTQVSDDTAFTWNLQGGSGAQLSVASYPGSGGGNGLEVDYDGVSQPALTQQLLLLAPGVFTVRGREDTSNAGSVESGADAGVRWQVVCANGQTLLGQSDVFGAGQGERAFAFRFTVPAGCPAEWIRLVPVAAERPHEITLWFTGLSVEGPGAGAPVPASSPTAAASQSANPGAR
jgi:hypothetical protein